LLSCERRCTLLTFNTGCIYEFCVVDRFFDSG